MNKKRLLKKISFNINEDLDFFELVKKILSEGSIEDVGFDIEERDASVGIYSDSLDGFIVFSLSINNQNIDKKQYEYMFSSKIREFYKEENFSSLLKEEGYKCIMSSYSNGDKIVRKYIEHLMGKYDLDYDGNVVQIDSRLPSFNDVEIIEDSIEMNFSEDLSSIKFEFCFYI